MLVILKKIPKLNPLNMTVQYDPEHDRVKFRFRGTSKLTL